MANKEVENIYVPKIIVYDKFGVVVEMENGYSFWIYPREVVYRREEKWIQ